MNVWDPIYGQDFFKVGKWEEKVGGMGMKVRHQIDAIRVDRLIPLFTVSVGWWRLLLLAYGVWFMVYGLWLMANDQWLMADG